jgi:glycerol-3-phosphate acyltransferase PlsY
MASPADLGVLLPPLALAAGAGYVLGALPFGYLVARSRGVNIFEVGSRSPGATNVRRVLGKNAGATVLALDLLKGAAAAGWPLLFAFCYARSLPPPPDQPAPLGFAPQMASASRLAGYVGLAFALAGHSFSCFTRFRGGKGVATAAGGLLVLMPLVALGSAMLWAAVFYTTRYVSLASILAALSLPVLALLAGGGRVGIAVATLVALFVVLRHRANIGRLLGGTEKRFERRKAEPSP